jgi:hypothetical protein
MLGPAHHDGLQEPAAINVLSLLVSNHNLDAPHLSASCFAGMRQALQLFVAVFRPHPTPAVEALSWMLTPDADQGVEARVEAAEGTAFLCPLTSKGCSGSLM